MKDRAGRPICVFAALREFPEICIPTRLVPRPKAAKTQRWGHSSASVPLRNVVTDPNGASAAMNPFNRSGSPDSSAVK